MKVTIGDSEDEKLEIEKLKLALKLEQEKCQVEKREKEEIKLKLNEFLKDKENNEFKRKEILNEEIIKFKKVS